MRIYNLSEETEETHEKEITIKVKNHLFEVSGVGSFANYWLAKEKAFSLSSDVRFIS
jgi:hypothetical protein